MVFINMYRDSSHYTTIFNHFRLLTLIMSLTLAKTKEISEYKESVSWMTLVCLHTKWYDLIVSLPKKRAILEKQACTLVNTLLVPPHEPTMIRIEIMLSCITRSQLYEYKEHLNQTLVIGLAVDNALRMQNNGGSLSNFVDPILKLIVNNMICSKVPVEDRYLVALASFYKKFLTQTVYETKKLSNFEKWLLRSPEVVIKGDFFY